MTQDNLPARTLAMAAIRAAEAQGGGGMVLKRGDPGSGVIMIKVMDRRGNPLSIVKPAIQMVGPSGSAQPAQTLCQKLRLMRGLPVSASLTQTSGLLRYKMTH